MCKRYIKFYLFAGYRILFYWQFWNEYWKNLADLSRSSDESQESPPSPPAPAAADDLTPKDKYAYLTEYGTQILCLLTPDKGCSYLSRNFESITGNSAVSCFGKEFFQMVHADFRERLKELLSKQPEQGKPAAYRCKLKHADQKHYWYLFLIHGKHQAQSEEFVCVIENVHDNMQVQSSLQKAKMEAELALRARSEFLANMSHDLRTPLNAVIGFAQMMESQMFGPVGNPQYLEYAKHIQESGYDLLAKIEDLLEISSIDAGRVSLEREELFLNDLLKHAVETQLHHASAAKVTLQYQLLCDNARLFVDRLKLQHILGHLISNAIKHSDAGSRVTVEASLSAREELLLRVSDEGAGIPKPRLSAMMGALKQDNCWSAKNNEGIGLGLALTKEFVALHGGSVDITSKVGAGTTVYISLPSACIVSGVKSPVVLLHA